MSATGLPAFDKTVHETNAWIKDVMDRLHTDDRQMAYHLLRATLHALRDRIGPESAAHLAAQLPMLLRGIYYEGWKGTSSATHDRTEAAFLERVLAECPEQWALDGEQVAKAVFGVMWNRIDEGQIVKVIHVLPPELKHLWPWRAQRS